MECLVQQSEQLACQHAMEEEASVGEDGSNWERTKVLRVLAEASNSLCFLKAYTNDQGLNENRKRITGSPRGASAAG